jgi:VCBS repeat-containing protein
MITKTILTGFLIMMLSLSAVTLPLSANASPNERSGERPQVVSAHGYVPGKNLEVFIWLLVPHGADKNEVVTQALARHGALPFVSEKFVDSGRYWDQFGDGPLDNDFVKQNYNPANEVPGGLQALLNTHNTWNSVSSSSFVFDYNGTTTRCPSLVDECPGEQVFDGLNDVAWLSLYNEGVLGVAWSGINIDESDIAMNTDFNWFTDGTEFYDLETVMLHENGHFLGLGHSEDNNAVMYFQYNDLQRVLSADDIAGVSSIYPAGNSGNNSPTALNDVDFVSRGDAVTINVAENDFDSDGTLNLSSIVITQPPTNANSLVDNNDGTLTYTHDNTATVSDSFKYTINDNDDATSNEATVSISVLPPVVIYDDDIENGENGWTTTGLWHQSTNRANSQTHSWYYGDETVDYNTGSHNWGYLTSPAISLDGAQSALLEFNEWSELEVFVEWDRTRVQASSDGSNWSTVFESHGTNDLWELRHVNLDSYAGGDLYLRFYFDTFDDLDNFSEGWYVDDIRILVDNSNSNPNNPPIAGFSQYDTLEDTLLQIPAPGVLGNATDLDDDAMTAILDTDVANGSLTLNADGSFSYTPDTNFNGADSFTYHANDGTDDSNTATVSITIDAVNDAPTADARGPYNAMLGNNIVFDGSGSLDLDGDLITYFWDFGDGNNSADENPSHTYGSGGIFSVTLVVNDGNLDSSVSNTSADISLPNNLPVANNQTVPLVGSSVVVTLTGSDLDGDTLSFSIVSNPSDGRLSKKITTISPTEAEVKYTAKRSFSGSDSFTFWVNDGTDNSNVATITIGESAVNSSPVANDDSVSGTEDNDLEITLSATDTDGDALTYTILSGPSDGILNGAGPDVTYTPDPGFSGTDSFTFNANDGADDSNTATVFITINPPTPSIEVHVGTLGGGSTPANGPWSNVNVDILIHDSDEGTAPSGVIVSGFWSGIISGSDSCTTNSSGVCSVSDRTKSSGDAIFTVTGLDGDETIEVHPDSLIVTVVVT